MGKKKTTLDWVLLVVIVVAVTVGGYFLYQNAIKYMIWPEKPPIGWSPPASSAPLPRIPSYPSFGVEAHLLD